MLYGSKIEYLRLQKSVIELVRKKAKVLRHFKVDPVLDVDDIFHSSAESNGIIKGVQLKGTVSVISSDLPIADSQRYPLNL